MSEYQKIYQIFLDRPDRRIDKEATYLVDKIHGVGKEAGGRIYKRKNRRATSTGSRFARLILSYRVAQSSGVYMVIHVGYTTSSK